MSTVTTAPIAVQPHTFVALRLPSGAHKVTKLVPDTTISLGKYGSFHVNKLLGRPYYLTFEIVDKPDDNSLSQLRVVPASEIHAEALVDDVSPSESRDEAIERSGDNTQFDLVSHDGEILMRNNRLTIDDPTRQALSMDEIEELKKVEAGSGKDIIMRIMRSHAALEEKTAFSLAKYTLRKSRKYLKRFTVLPLDVSTLMQWMLHEREPSRIMEIREEVLGLTMAWLNIHYGLQCPNLLPELIPTSKACGRWLVVDDTSALLVAAVAERMGILHPDTSEQEEQASEDDLVAEENTQVADTDTVNGATEAQHTAKAGLGTTQHAKHRRYPPDAMSAEVNTITLVHPASQPNLMALSYFSYDPLDVTRAGSMESSSHPLHTHLKTLSWLQLVSPQLDTAYMEPEKVTEEVLAGWKAGKRGSYFRKRRRWERVKRVVDDTRAGGFDGLLVASATSPDTILHRLVPLVRGGGQVVVYSPNVEGLADLVDAYSSSRKTAFLQALSESPEGDEQDLLASIPNEDFPLDPRLLLSTNLQTVHATEWQVLSGRTHPLMTSRGGAEGYVFTGTKVLPVEGGVAARGTFSKKRKVG